MSTTEDQIEPTLHAMAAAVEAVRTANHAAFHAPRDPGALYERIGTLYDLLCKTEQLAQFLTRAVRATIADPPPGLYTTIEGEPLTLLGSTASFLSMASGQLTNAKMTTNDAFKTLSPVGWEPPEEGG